MLETRNLSKRYGNFLALDQLTLDVQAGSIFGFVGPNGAGKTTTMRILATLMRSSGGTARIDGIDVDDDPLAVRKTIGYMPDFFGVYDNLRVTEYLEFYGRSAGLSAKQCHSAAADFLALVDLSEKSNFYVDTLSRGMKQRLCLARCLMHNPKLLILDEPASGMDPRARVEMMGILRELRHLGKTILISSHILPELGELCDTIGIMERGRLVMQGGVAEILARASGVDIVKVTLVGTDQIEDAVRLLQEHQGVTGLHCEENTIRVEGEIDDASLPALLKRLVLADIPVAGFGRSNGNLEQVFMEVTVDEQH